MTPNPPRFMKIYAAKYQQYLNGGDFITITTYMFASWLVITAVV